MKLRKEPNGALIYGFSPAAPYVRSARRRTSASECRALQHRSAMNKGFALAPLRGYPMIETKRYSNNNQNTGTGGTYG